MMLSYELPDGHAPAQWMLSGRPIPQIPHKVN
jgi:hypothetical protein